MLRRSTLAASVALLWLTAGCATGADRLPPPTIAEIAPLYEDELAAMGVRLTPRGGLIDTSSGYESSPEGTHLALYLAPVEDQPLEEYVDGLTELTALFAEDVFERWPGLESFDVCQEKYVDDGPLGPVYSQVNLTRALATSIDWEQITVDQLLEATETDEQSYVRTTGALRRHVMGSAWGA